MTSTREEPRRRRNGLCAGEGCDRPLVVATARHHRYGGAMIDVEPFCSTECAKRFHGQQEEEGAEDAEAVHTSAA